MRYNAILYAVTFVVVISSASAELKLEVVKKWRSESRKEV